MKPHPIRLSENFRALFYTPFYAAYANGFYADEGVEVELRTSPDPSASAQALQDGSVDVIWGGPLRVLTLHERDPDCELVCFADCVHRDPFFIVGREPRPSFQLADLTGTRLATVSEVSPPWLCLQDDLRRAGIEPHSIPRMDGPSMAQNAAALTRGEIDAAQLFEPEVEELVRSGRGHIWYAAASRGPTAYTMLVTRRALLRERREELRGMVRALARTLRWIYSTPGAEIAMRLETFFPDVPQAVYAAAVERYKDLSLWANSPTVSREGFDRIHAAMRAGGALSRDIDFENCVDPSLAIEVSQ